MLNNVFKRVIEQANGNKIWVPLSAGYDSRTVLAKLLELGYDRIQTFSYGTPGNMESVVAKEISEKAGVPWCFVSSNLSQKSDKQFTTGLIDFLLNTGSCSSAPPLAEFLAIKRLSERGVFEAGDILVNGQTGDFLTGGHLPNISNYRELIEFIHTKHFSILSEKGDEYHSNSSTEMVLRKWAQENFPGAFDANSKLSKLFSDYQMFEWHERQAGYVVNQQRTYEYFGLSWALPFWDAELMEFYQDVPFELQYGQKLYFDYLSNWNYGGLFDEGRRPYNPWPKYRTLVVFTARLGWCLGGESAKALIYRFLYYFSDQYYLYQFFGWKNYLSLLPYSRNVIAQVSLEYLVLLKRKLACSKLNEFEKLHMKTRSK